jgi:hypothetical protein
LVGTFRRRHSTVRPDEQLRVDDDPVGFEIFGSVVASIGLTLAYEAWRTRHFHADTARTARRCDLTRQPELQGQVRSSDGHLVTTVRPRHRRRSLVQRSWGMSRDVSAWSRVPPEAPTLTPHAPSQKGWFWVRPQAQSAARVSRSGPSGVSRTRSPRTSSGSQG